MDVVKLAEIKHQAADALSRLQAIGKDRTPLREDLQMLAIDTTENEEEIRISGANFDETLSLNSQSPQTDNTQPSEEEMILEEANDNYNRVPATKAGHSYLEFTMDKKSLLKRI